MNVSAKKDWFEFILDLNLIDKHLNGDQETFQGIVKKKMKFSIIFSLKNQMLSRSRPTRMLVDCSIFVSRQHDRAALQCQFNGAHCFACKFKRKRK